MAKSGKASAWVLLLLLNLWATWAIGGDAAQAGAPSPTAMDCTDAFLSLADCLTFVEAGSKLAKPQGKCCSGLKKVVKDQVACLCQAFAGSSDFGVTLNLTKALTLPSVCRVSTPPFSKCNIAVGAPGSAPVLSPGGSPSSSPATEQSISPTPVPAPAPAPAQSTAASSFQSQSIALLVTLAAAALCYRL